MDGLGSPVPSPNDLVYPTSINDDEESLSESSARDKPKRVHVEEENDDRKGHKQDDVNSGSNDANILEMELLNGKVLNTPLEDDLSASPNSSVCLELRPPTTKRPTKRKKTKRAEILTQSCIDDSTTKDDVNSGSNDAHILEMELLNGKVLNTPLEDDLSASPNLSVCLELRPPTTKRATKRKKTKRAEILTQSCIDDSTTKDEVIVIDHSTANAPVTVKALQALQLLLNNGPS
jgi:hypothetical protein